MSSLELPRAALRAPVSPKLPMPALIKAWDAAPGSDPLKAKTADQIAVLRKWELLKQLNDRMLEAESVPRVRPGMAPRAVPFPFSELVSPRNQRKASR